MIQVKARHNLSNFRIPAVTFDKSQLERLGNVGLDAMKARTEKGIGPSGSSMKPLNPAYAKAKSKAGLGSIRDLVYTGAMLAGFAIEFITDTGVHIGFSSQAQRLKALLNEKIEPWIGWAESDAKAVKAEAQRMLNQNTERARTFLTRYNKPA